MQSGNSRGGAELAGFAAGDGTDDGSQAILEGIVRLGRVWLEGMSATDPRREHVIRMDILAGELLGAGDRSQSAMQMVQGLLCANCKRLVDIDGSCPARAPDRCRLLGGGGT